MSVAIRRAVAADIPRIVELAIESVSVNPIPVVIDRAAMAETAKATIAGNAHFVWVAVEDGQVVGCVGAAVQPGFWFERLQASVLMFYTTRPGAGIALLREFARWVKSRPAIKLAIFSLEPGMDPRIGQLLQRLGFGHTAPTFTYIRGMK